MGSLKRERSQEREAADDRLVKRMRMEKGPTFKKKSHEKQFQFYATVLDKMEEATACSIAADSTCLEEGMASIKTRWKHIRNCGQVSRQVTVWLGYGGGILSCVEDELSRWGG